MLNYRSIDLRYRSSYFSLYSFTFYNIHPSLVSFSPTYMKEWEPYPCECLLNKHKRCVTHYQLKQIIEHTHTSFSALSYTSVRQARYVATWKLYTTFFFLCLYLFCRVPKKLNDKTTSFLKWRYTLSLFTWYYIVCGYLCGLFREAFDDDKGILLF